MRGDKNISWNYEEASIRYYEKRKNQKRKVACVRGWWHKKTKKGNFDQVTLVDQDQNPNPRSVLHITNSQNGRYDI